MRHRSRRAGSIARRTVQRSTSRVGPALESLERLQTAGESFDVVFIDADKRSYVAYFDRLISSDLLAPNGLIAIDNTLMQGETYVGARTPNGIAIAEFNRHVADDPRVENVMLPLRDGLTLVRRASTP